MKGADIKAEIKRLGYTLTQVAEALGESQQNLNSALSNDNIKTGTRERVAAFLGKPVSYFYGEGNTAAARAYRAPAPLARVSVLSISLG